MCISRVLSVLSMNGPCADEVLALSFAPCYLDNQRHSFHPTEEFCFVLLLRTEDLPWVYPWLRGLGYTSLTVFLLGFLLWNIDNIFCDSLRNFRKRVPPVLGVTTQFHAWWHILTGLGSYLHILFSLYTRTLYLRYRPKVKFLFGIWPAVMFEPQRKH
ncbi:alkaline ceramidase 3 isoform 4 [Mus musculus]|uniref:alkaline ceramidase 3 isoform 4 n=1 Tax=Mus musculus TaxID=10090 RepID=UPI000CDB9EB6|nr:alkaline ceramidase 3 isoform 4 [Mus musculus]